MEISKSVKRKSLVAAVLVALVLIVGKLAYMKGMSISDRLKQNEIKHAEEVRKGLHLFTKVGSVQIGARNYSLYRSNIDPTQCLIAHTHSTSVAECRLFMEMNDGDGIQ